MVRESAVIRFMRADYSVIGLQFENTYKKTDLLLRLYRKTNWGLDEKLDELRELTYDSCLGDMETLSYLMNFAPDREFDLFRSKAVSAMQTKVLIDLIENAMLKLKNFPDGGKLYYSILHLKYMDFFEYSEDELLEQLDLERSTYYRKKKEATHLLGYILFGFVMPQYINLEKVANI